MQTTETSTTRYSGRDAVVETGDHVEDELKVLDLFNEVREKFERAASRTHYEARRNDLFYDGRAWDFIDSVSSAYHQTGTAAPITRANRARTQRNYLRSLVQTWSAFLNRGRPSVKGYPSHASPIAMRAADVVNRYIAYLRQKTNHDSLWTRATKKAQLHASIGIRTTWDPDSGPERDGMALGEIEFRPFTVFDYITDLSEDFNTDGKYCATRRIVDVDDARKVLRDADIADEPQVIDQEQDEVDTSTMTRADGVEVWDFWHRPSARIPKGLFALIVGGHVVEAREFPYEHGELPLTVWVIDEVTGTPFGGTHVNDAVPVQQSLNESHTVIRGIRRDISEFLKFFGPKAIVEEIGSELGALALSDPEMAKALGWVTPPLGVVGDLRQLADRDRDDLHENFGLNDVTTGATKAAASASGRSVAYQAELDTNKLQGPARNRDECMLRIWRQALALVRQYQVEPRVVTLRREDGSLDQFAFDAADLDGVDVQLEPFSAEEQSGAARANAAVEGVGQGIVDPTRGAELARTGLEETGGEFADRSAAQAMIGAALGGRQLDMPISNPAIAMQEIQAAISMMGPLPQLLALAQRLTPPPVPAGGSPGPEGPGRSLRTQPAQLPSSSLQGVVGAAGGPL